MFIASKVVLALLCYHIIIIISLEYDGLKMTMLFTAILTYNIYHPTRTCDVTGLNKSICLRIECWVIISDNHFE